MTQPTVCPGRENDAWRRATVDYHQALLNWQNTPEQQRGDRPTRPDHTPTTGDPIWCRRCTATIRARLNTLDDLAALAAATADGNRGTGDREKVAGSTEPPSPSPTQNMLDELYRDLVDLEDWHRDEMRYDRRPQRGNAGAGARTLVIAWLAAHLDTILRRPGATDAGHTILHWHRRLQAATKSKPDTIRLPTRCPRCDLRSLRRKDDGYIHCDNQSCGRLMSETEHDEVADQQATKEAS